VQRHIQGSRHRSWRRRGRRWVERSYWLPVSSEALVTTTSSTAMSWQLCGRLASQTCSSHSPVTQSGLRLPGNFFPGRRQPTDPTLWHAYST
jgi:hypothetical protein